MTRGGKSVGLGMFATAEEAALCVTRSPEGRAAAERPAAARRAAACQTALCFARSPEGQAVAAERAAAAAGRAAAVPLSSEEARQQAQAEGLTLRVAKSKTGYFGVSLANPGKPKPYQAHVYHGGKLVYLGTFATAEEAALCVARIPEGQTEEARRQARQQARAGELTQLVALLVKEEEWECSEGRPKRQRTM